jgi:hypothetical protein
MILDDTLFDAQSLRYRSWVTGSRRFRNAYQSARLKPEPCRMSSDKAVFAFDLSVRSRIT